MAINTTSQHAVFHFKKHKPAYVLRCSRHLEQQSILECSQGNVIHENWNLSSATLRVIAVQVLAAGIICSSACRMKIKLEIIRPA